VRIIGVLCWYDEAPSWLAACVSSMCQRAQCDHIVAVDGAYAMLPDGRAYSGFEQHQIIDEICRGSDVGLTLYAPQEVWFGNEIEKRSFSFKLAETVAEIGEDWYFVMDADEVVTQAVSLRHVLEETEEDAAYTWFYERFDPFVSAGSEALARRINMPRESKIPVRTVFRALPRLHVHDNHFTYLTDNGSILWNGGNGGEVEAVDTRVEIEHRTRLRDMARKEQQAEYYRRRDLAGQERTHVGQGVQNVVA
jgi:hypothetical protein